MEATCSHMTCSSFTLLSQTSQSAGMVRWKGSRIWVGTFYWYFICEAGYGVCNASIIMCACACVYVGHRWHRLLSTFIFWDMVSHRTWSSLIQWAWLCLCSPYPTPALGLQVCTTTLSFYMLGGLNSGPHACTVDALATGPRLDRCLLPLTQEVIKILNIYIKKVKVNNKWHVYQFIEDAYESAALLGI